MKMLSLVGKSHSKAQGWFQLSVVKEGKVVRTFPKQKNLILNQGMNQVAQSYWVTMLRYCNAGTANTPTSVDSGVITASQSGTRVTTTAPFFTSQMVDEGRVIKWDTGPEALIVTYVSATEVDVAEASTEIPSPVAFTVYNTNQTALGAHVKRSNTYLLGAGNTEVVRDNDLYKIRRTYDFTAEVGGTVQYQEVAVGWGTASTAIFNRIVVSPAVSVSNGEQLRVVYELQLTVAPSAPEAVTVPISGWSNTEGQQGMQCLGLGSIDIGTGVETSYDSGSYAGEPADASFSAFVSVNSAPLPSFGTTLSRAPVAGVSATNTRAAYIANSFYIDKTCVIGVGTGNSDLIRTMGIGYNGSPSYGTILCFVFDNPMTKLNTHTLSLTWRFSWGRVLS